MGLGVSLSRMGLFGGVVEFDGLSENSKLLQSSYVLSFWPINQSSP